MTHKSFIAIFSFLIIFHQKDTLTSPNGAK